MHDYMPIMRLHRAETRAYAEVSTTARQRMLPVFEVPPVRLPLGCADSRLTLVKRLIKHAADIGRATLAERALVDLDLLDPEWRDNRGRTATEVLFASQLLFRHLVPVVSSRQCAETRAAIWEVVRSDNMGVGLRLHPSELSRNAWGSKGSPLMQDMRCHPEDIDLIIDHGYIEEPTAYLNVLDSPALQLPWRTVTVAGGAFPSPATLRAFDIGDYVLPRYEWQAWETLRERAPRDGVRLAFGDYLTEHASYERPPDVCFPTASIRYALSHDWLWIKGASIRNRHFGGYAQWPAYAQALCRRDEFFGSSFSQGDCYIYNVAQGAAGPGNASTWRQAGVSHHVAVVLDQLARTNGPSMHPVSRARAAGQVRSGV